MKQIFALSFLLGLSFGVHAQESHESNVLNTPSVETEVPVQVETKPVRNTNPDFAQDVTEEQLLESSTDSASLPTSLQVKNVRDTDKVITHEAVTTTESDGKVVFKFEGKTTATLAGIVKDSRTFNPLAGAMVKAGDQVTYTNEHGRFKLGGFESAETNVVVDAEGYYSQTQVATIQGRSSALMVFKLENENEEVIEISEADLLKIKLAPANSTVKAGRQFFCFFEAPDGFEREAWIGIVKKESAVEVADPESSNEVFMYKYLLHKVQGDLLFKAPENHGNYEIRMYNKRENGKMVAAHILNVISK